MNHQDFLPVADHFAHLVATLEPSELEAYNKLRHCRAEACFRNRSFIVYRITDRRPEVLDTLAILDFQCCDARGATTEIRSNNTEETIIVGYTPVRLFDFPIFVHLSLHTKLRWSAGASDIGDGSLAFDLSIRTQSRLHARERGVTYCETGVAYSREFQTNSNA